jgi:hypothetical protein
MPRVLTSGARDVALARDVRGTSWQSEVAPVSDLLSSTVRHAWSVKIESDGPCLGLLAVERRGEKARKLLEGAGELRGKLVEARAALRDVLDARGMVLGAVDAARIDACTELDAFVRWHRQAVVTASVAEALRLLHGPSALTIPRWRGTCQTWQRSPPAS